MGKVKVWQAALIGLGLLVCFSCCGGCVVTDGPLYSEGHRDGRVQKFSYKGVFRKSHEGELALAGFKKNGDDLGNVWEFSVEDGEKGVIEELDSLGADEPVRLHYHQKLWFSPFHYSTSYRVWKVERLNRAEAEKR